MIEMKEVIRKIRWMVRAFAPAALRHHLVGFG